MALRLASEGRSPEAIADHLRGSAERRCARISGNATRQKRKGGRSHPSQTTIAEGHQGYRSLLPVCRSSPGAGSTAPGAQGFDAHEIFLSPTGAREFPGWYPAVSLGSEPGARTEGPG